MRLIFFKLLWLTFLLPANNLFAGGSNASILTVEYKVGDFQVSELSDLDFQSFKNNPLTGYLNESIWFRIAVTNKDLKITEKYLLIENQSVSDFQFFETFHNIIEPTPESKEYTYYPNIKINFKAGQVKTFYVKIIFKNYLNPSFSLLNRADMRGQGQKAIVLLSICFGIYFAMFTYNALHFLIFRDRSHLFYSLFVASASASMGVIFGFDKLLFDVSSSTTILFLFANLGIFAVMFFSREFLRCRIHLPITNKIIVSLGLMALLNIFVGLLFNIQNFVVIDILILVGAFICISGSYQRWRQGYTPARFYLLSWGILAVSAALWIAFVHGFSSNFVAKHSLLIGIAIEVILVAMAMAESINVLRNEMNQTLAQANTKLELRVKEEAKIIENQQAQLIENEKMASLGVLANGVAHEINNPLAIITGFSSLLTKEVEKDDIDQKNLVKIANKIRSTCERIANIVQGLILYSQKDVSDISEHFDPQSTIEEAVRLASTKHQNKSIEIIHNKPDQRWVVNGQQGLLLQVLNNLLTNALDSLETMDHGKITIDYFCLDSILEILVRDNGAGVSPEYQAKIFDPFFTTKSPDKGTGLGLCVSRSMMQSQDGDLFFRESAQGAIFGIRLKIIQLAPKTA
jgi:two-component system, NtrC family, sensor kinase